jgi:hypothetical protein
MGCEATSTLLKRLIDDCGQFDEWSNKELTTTLTIAWTGNGSVRKHDTRLFYYVLEKIANDVGSVSIGIC